LEFELRNNMCSC